jgi:methionyl-tRNA synthetase
VLERPHEVVSSEFLTMEGRKFSSSRNVVIYVGDLLSRYDPDALRYYLAVAGPENQDTDFTWAEFVRRNNDELVAGWGNLVNRTISMTAKNLGAIPPRGTLTDADFALLSHADQAFGTVGELLARSRQKAAITEAMGVVGAANKYLSDMAPWKLRTEDPERMARVLHVALQVVDDCKTLLTPFLPSSSSKVHAQLGGTGEWAAMPDLVEVDEPTAPGSPSYHVLTGDYDTSARWQSVPIEAGRPIAPPTPVFTKLDPSVVDEELARLADAAGV